VRFTALGTGTISLSAARSCSGYLLETSDVRLLVDCGSGVTRRLAELGP
jgi:ribonuclease BN (tRNA processing enzyme)